MGLEPVRPIQLGRRKAVDGSMPWATTHRFKEEDLVLKKILPNARYPRGKWTPNYKGPYMISSNTDPLKRTRARTSSQRKCSQA
ncbi:hypothetical protein CR513_52065, partial [Mucuna pruriens]